MIKTTHSMLIANGMETAHEIMYAAQMRLPKADYAARLRVLSHAYAHYVQAFNSSALAKEGSQLIHEIRQRQRQAKMPGASWPCSTLSNRRVFAEFDGRGNLVDVAIDGRSDRDCDGHEFNAMMDDFRREYSNRSKKGETK